MNGRNVQIRVIDLIDVYITIVEAKCKWYVADFLLYFFPDDTNEEDFKRYWNEYDLIDERQRPQIEDIANELKRKLRVERKWKE